MTIARRHMQTGDTKSAFKEYLLSAEEGHLQAQFLIAQMYQYGSGTDKNLREASKWYSLAADRGLDKAQNNLAVMYLNGRGIIQDTKMAAYWFEKAAAQGHVKSTANLADIYLNGGEGIDVDFLKARKLYLQAAKEGNTKAQNNLGFIYFEGKGVSKNYQTAYMWFHIAAQIGSDEAEVNKFDMEEVISPDEKMNALTEASIWLQKFDIPKEE